MLQVIQETIARVLKDRSLDWRTCFASVRADPPEGRIIVIELSDPGALRDVRLSLSEAGVDAGGRIAYVELPAAGEGFPEVLVASSSVADVRRSAAHSAELVTQIVWGDAVTPLKSQGEWILVRLDDAYVGWVRSWHLTGRSRREFEELSRAAGHRVRDNVLQIFEAPSDGALPVSDAVVGTPMAVEPCSRRGWRRVTLLDGRHGFVKVRGVERRPLLEMPQSGSGRTPVAARALRQSLSETALRFLGVPYVWGGTTPKGFDCSGLVQRVYRLHGIVIPRDSDMQARFGRAIDPGKVEDLQPGELLFFGKKPTQITHVALCLSNGTFVHAHGQVRVNALLPSHPLFDEKLTGDWQLVRDPLLV